MLAGVEGRVDTDDNGEALSVAPQVCTGAGNVYVVWYDRRDVDWYEGRRPQGQTAPNPNGNMSVYFNRRGPDGVWGVENGLDKRLNTGPYTGPGTNALVPRICCNGNNVYVVWYEEDRVTRNTAIYFNRSLDGGLTWMREAIRIDSAPFGSNAREPEICCTTVQQADGPMNIVYVAWRDLRDGAWNIYANRSVDGGATWLRRDVPVHDHDSGNPSRSESVKICCDGPRLYAAWLDERDGGRDVYFNASDNFGLTFDAVSQRISARGHAAGVSTYIDLCCEGDRVIVAYDARRFNVPGPNNNPDVILNPEPIPEPRDAFPYQLPKANIFVNRSENGGAAGTWLAESHRLERTVDQNGFPILPYTIESEAPRICCDGELAYVCWQRNAFVGSLTKRVVASEIHCGRSMDGGATWSLVGDAGLIDHAPVFTRAFRPVICCDGQSVTVAWHDDRFIFHPAPSPKISHPFSIWLTHSNDAGLRWTSPDTRVDLGDEFGAFNSFAVELACDGEAFLVWADDRDDTVGHDIYFNSVSLGPEPTPNQR